MKKVKKVWALLAFFSVLVYNTNAQLAMTRSVFNSAFVPVNSGSGGGTLSTAIGDDVFQSGIPIGFTFNYFGNAYTTISSSSNGWISFFTPTSSQASNLNLTTTTGSLIVGPWWDDLRTDSAVYITQGVPGSQVFTYQWYAKSYYTGATQQLRFQVKLYEGTDVIEFLYGAIIAGTTNIDESASIGLKTPGSGNGNYIDAFTGSSFVSTAFLNSSTKWPVRNYRFTPGVPVALSGGIYNVGNSQTYPNIQEAIADVNHRGITGPVTLALTQSVYDLNTVNGNNYFPVFFGPVNGASTTNTISLEPASATSTLIYDGAIGGSASNAVSTSAFGTTNEPIIGLVGSRFINLNNLFLTTSLTTGSLIDRGIAFINQSAAAGTQSCSVRNVTVSLNRSNTSSIGFETRTATTPTIASGANSFNSFLNISISNVYNGFLLSGTAAFPDLSNVISTTSPTLFNAIGSPTANDIGNGTSTAYGIQALNQSGVNISNNIVQNVSVNGSILSDGIFLNALQGISSVYNNKVLNIRNLSASATSGVTGIRSNIATTGTHQIRVYNNFISGINSNYTGAASATRQLKGIFVQSAGGGAATQTINIDFNNVSIDGSLNPNISSSCYEIGTTSGPVIHTRNNVFANFTGAQTAPASHYTWRSTSATLVGNTGSVSDYNDLYVANATQGFVGQGNTTDYATLVNWQIAMTQDANSISCDPQFFNNVTDLHVAGICLNSAANSSNISWVTNDIDNAPRSITPDIGADEFDLCTSVTAGNINPSSYTICQGQSVNLNSIGASSAGGTQYSWLTSSSFNGPYNPVTVGSGSNTTSYNTGTLNAGTYYFVHESICVPASLSALSNTVTVTVNSLPTINVIASNTLFCSPSVNPISLTASGAVNYTWSPAASLSSSVGANVNSTPSVTTTYTTIGADVNGCVASTTTEIQVSFSPFIVSAVASPSVLCTTGNSQLNVTGYGTGLVNTYAFTPTTGSALMPITIATTVVPSSVDDTPMAAPANIGFTFNYNGVNYTQFTASPDGWVMLGGAIGVNQFSNLVASTTNIPKLYPYWDDLATGTTGYVRTSLIGTAPTRTFVIEWFVTIPRATTGPANSTFQALLHEATGEVEFRYGTMGSASMSASSGLTGGATNFNCVTITGPTNSTITANNANAVQPASGVSYLFTPPTPTYSWSPATFLSSTTINNPLVNNINTTTNYSVELTSNGCSNTSTVDVTIATPSVTAISSNSAICLGNTATLTASGMNTYTWNPGPLNTAIITVTPNSTTIFTVDATDVNNCTASETITLIVNPNPTISITGNTTVCLGGTITLTANGADTYTWNTSSNSSSISVSPTALTIYSVTGTSSLTGCESNSTHTLNILPLPTVSITSPTTTICAGNSVLLTGNGANTYSWSTSAVINSITVSPSVTTTYTLYGVDANLCENSSTINITVNALPNVSLTAATNTACVNSGTILLTGSPSGGVFSGPNVTGNTLNPTATGTFSPVYSYTNVTTGCSNTASTSIVVSSCVGLNSVTGNGGILNIYPNPNTGNFTIETTNVNEMLIEIMDLTGRVVYKTISTLSSTNINFQEFANGVYSLKITSGNNTETIKLIKQ